VPYYEQGNYDCIVQAQGFGVSKVKRTPYFWLQVQPCKHNGEELLNSQYSREVQLYLTDKTVDRVIAQLRGIGWDGESWKDLEVDGDHSFKNVNVQLICEHEQGENGTVYDRFRFPSPDMATPEQTKGVAKKLDALFGKALKGKGKPAAKPKPVVPEVAADEPEDDDIPF